MDSILTHDGEKKKSSENGFIVKETSNVLNEDAIQEMIDQRIAQYIHQYYPQLNNSITIFDFMKSTEMKLYRAALVVVPFGFVIGFAWWPINIAIMLLLYFISGVLFNSVNRQKSSILLYRLTGRGVWLGRIMFVVMSVIVVYMTRSVAWIYRASVEAINDFFAMIWANLQTLNTITEKAWALKDGVVNTATNVGNSIANTASTVGNAVGEFFNGGDNK